MALLNHYEIITKSLTKYYKIVSKMLILTLTRTLPQMSVSNLAAHGKFIAADTIIIVSKKAVDKEKFIFLPK